MGAHLTLKGIAIRHLTHAQLFRVITDPWMESKVDNLTDDGRWVTEEEERASVSAIETKGAWKYYHHSEPERTV